MKAEWPTTLFTVIPGFISVTVIVIIFWPVSSDERDDKAKSVPKQSCETPKQMSDAIPVDKSKN